MANSGSQQRQPTVAANSGGQQWRPTAAANSSGQEQWPTAAANIRGQQKLHGDKAEQAAEPKKMVQQFLEIIIHTLMNLSLLSITITFILFTKNGNTSIVQATLTTYIIDIISIKKVVWVT